LLSENVLAVLIRVSCIF